MRQAYTGPDGVFSALQPDSLLIDSSTIEASVAKEMALIAEEQGSIYIDAPVSGGECCSAVSSSECVCV